jgi:hypothetical protein
MIFVKISRPFGVLLARKRRWRLFWGTELSTAKYEVFEFRVASQYRQTAWQSQAACVSIDAPDHFQA